MKKKYLIILLILFTFIRCDIERKEYEIAVSIRVEYLNSEIDTLYYTRVSDLSMVSGKGLRLKENGSLYYIEQYVVSESKFIISNGIRSYEVLDSNVTQIK